MGQYAILRDEMINSSHLERKIRIRYVGNNKQPTKVVFMNDGQDLETLDFIKVLNDQKLKYSYLFVCIHSNENRLREYGTASMPDYKNRGDLAKKYNDFVTKELLNIVLEANNLQSIVKNQYFMGYSLGGLSAMDIVWNNEKLFSKVGVFSGSFWWRKKAYEDGYDDENDRIMQVLVRNSTKNEGQRFWFQCGTKDEDSDRNGNGIIDSIDDTQDLIVELVKKGYSYDNDIKYVEVIDGEHNQKTWNNVMPQFLKWLEED